MTITSQRWVVSACRRIGVMLVWLWAGGGLLPASGAIYTATVSSTNQQQVKGWGCMPGRQDLAASSNFNFLDRPLAVQAILGDLGITVARVYINYTYGNADGSLTANFDDVLDLVSTFQTYKLAYICTVWTPPLGMKTIPIAGSVDDNHQLNYLQPGMYGNFCAWIVNQLRAIQAAGLPLPIALSFQNEPTCHTQWAGCIYTPETYQTVLKQLRAAMNTAGFASVQLLASEDGGYANGADWNNSVYMLGGSGFPALNDSTVNAAVGAFAAHSYRWPSTATYEDQWVAGCDRWGRDRWMSEYSYVDGPAGEDLTNHMNTAIGASRRLAADMAYIKNNYWLWWIGWGPALEEGESLADGGGISTLNKSNLYYVLRKVFRNVPPGSYVRRVVSSDPALVSTVSSGVCWMDMVSFRNGTRNVVLMVNPDTVAHSTDVAGLGSAVAEIHQTAGADQDLALTSTASVTAGRIADVSLPARSITIIKTTEANLVANPGFEGGMTGGWWMAYGGTGALVTTPTGDGLKAHSIWGDAGLRQRITSGFAVGDKLTLSGWGRLSAAKPVGGARISAFCVNASNSTLLATHLTYSTETNYTAKRATFTVPEGTTEIWVQSWSWTSGSGSAVVFYADDIALVQSNALQNSGYENGSTGWWIWPVGGVTGTITAISSPVHSGVGAMAMTGTRGMEQYLSDFTIGQTLTLSAWGCLSTPVTSGGGYAGLYCFDSSGTVLGKAVVSFTSETGYTQKTVSITIPPGTASAKVSVFNNGGAATFQVDDVEVLH